MFQDGVNGEYKWEDGWRIFLTNWANGQPVKEAQGGCVRMSADGRWSDDVCSKQYPSVCKISQGMIRMWTWNLVTTSTRN